VNRYLAPRTRHAPRIDGLLQDRAWAAAPRSDGFVAPSSDRLVPVETTGVKVSWDERQLYLAVESVGDEAVEVTVQPDVTSDRHLDLVISADGKVAGTLEARVAVKRGPGGWRLELAAPLASLLSDRRSPLGQRWGLNVARAREGRPVAVWSRPLPASAPPVAQCGDLIFANERGEDPSLALEAEEQER
jgi:hypothetical protein